MTLTVLPAGDVGWDAVRTVFDGPGDPGRCWCQWFRLGNRDFDAATDDERRAALAAEVASAAPGPGVVAERDGEPAGWCGVAPRAGLPRLLRSPLTRGLPAAADPLWSVTCFVVRPEHRRQGVARRLLAAAVEHAQAHGAATLEGYPVDAAARPRAGAAELYHGTVALFEDAGFTVVARPSAGRAVVRLPLASA